MVGILVHGANHFIVRGPLPDQEIALTLVRQWSLIQIGAVTPPSLDRWQIVTREFRENLEWAVVVPGDGEISSAVSVLLDELSARGVEIHCPCPTSPLRESRTSLAPSADGPGVLPPPQAEPE